MKKILYSFFISACAASSFAQPGTLDLTFDGDGFQLADISGAAADDNGYSTAIQSDGKIVVAGYSWSGSDYDVSVCRLNADGSFDNTFSGDGKVLTDFGGAGWDQFAGQVAIQPDGKIVVGGTSFNGMNNDFFIVRYNTNGTIDNSFDTDGMVVMPYGIASNDYGRDITVQSDGKIVYTGTTNDGGDLDLVLLRFNDNGTLDTGFDTDGIVITDNSGGLDETPRSVTVQADGKILVAGSGYLGVGNTDFLVNRYNTNGSLDVTFSGDGQFAFPVGSSDDVANCVVVHTDGKIFVSGYANNGVDNDFAVAKLNTNGTLDMTFDSDGKAITNILGGEDYSRGCVVMDNDNVALAGTANDLGIDGMAIVVYTVGGSLDATYDTDGIIWNNFMNVTYGESIALQSDGKMVVAGFGYGIAGADFVVARYEGEATSGCSIDLNVSQVGTTLTADATGGSTTYQWVDCDNAYADVAGETSQAFTATNAGNYAVIINDGTCEDTSACFNVCLVDVNVNASGFTLTAAAGADAYQWVDCDNAYADVAGETNQVFTASSNGNYAVIVTEGTCTDTSACYAANDLGTTAFDFENIRISPSPTNSTTTISSWEPWSDATVSVISITGQLMSEIKQVSGSSFTLDLSDYPNGFYIVEIHDGNDITRVEVIKQ